MYSKPQKIPFESLPIDFKNSLILLDIDGTLIPDSETNLTPAVKEKVTELKKENTVFLCSNKPDKKAYASIEKELGLQIINQKYRKPDPRILQEIPDTKEIPRVVIGDKILIDGLFAKLIHAKFILTERKTNGKESPLNKTAYLVDNFISSYIQKLH